MGTITLHPVAANEGVWRGTQGDYSSVVTLVQAMSGANDAWFAYNATANSLTGYFPALAGFLPFAAKPISLQMTVRAGVSQRLLDTGTNPGIRVQFSMAEGGTLAVNDYVLNALPLDLVGPLLSWPSNRTDAASAPVVNVASLASVPWFAYTVPPDPAVASLQVRQVSVAFRYATQPIPIVLTPTGTVNSTTRPIVTWNYTPGEDGGPQSRRRVRIYTMEEALKPGFTTFINPAVWDSGEQFSSSTSMQVGIDLLNNTSYQAIVNVAQETNGQAHWWGDNIQNGTGSPFFTIAIPPTIVPARPVITSVAESSLARIRVTAQQLTTPAWDSVTIERSNDNGTTWTTVRGANHAPATGATFIVWDYESANDELVTYRARGHRGAVISTNSLLTPLTSWVSTNTWLKAPTHPSLNRTVRFSSVPEARLNIAQGVFVIPGRRAPVVISDVRREPTIDPLSLLTTTLAEKNDVEALFNLSETLLLQSPANYDVGSRYIAASDVRVRRHNRSIQSPYRIIETTAVEVDSPSDDVVIGGTLTWQDVINKYTTWQDVINTFPTWADLLGTPAALLPNPPDVVVTPPVADSTLTDQSGNTIVDDLGNIIVVNATAVSPTGPQLIYRTDFRAGLGAWVAHSSTGPNTGLYPVTNSSVHIYRPAQVTTGVNGLVIEAVLESAQWYSGLVDTRYSLSFDMRQSLRFKARWKATDGKGTWPAIWLKPTPLAQGSETGAYGPWPRSGEIDIIEAGRGVHQIYGTVHMDDPFQSGTHVQFPTPNVQASDYTAFHEAWLDWVPGVGFDWYLDGTKILTAHNLPHPVKPFDQPFYPIINLAMGGTFVSGSPGNPDGTTPTTGNLLTVDYFEVYLL